MELLLDSKFDWIEIHSYFITKRPCSIQTLKVLNFIYWNFYQTEDEKTTNNVLGYVYEFSRSILKSTKFGIKYSSNYLTYSSDWLCKLVFLICNRACLRNVLLYDGKITLCQGIFLPMFVFALQGQRRQGSIPVSCGSKRHLLVSFRSSFPKGETSIDIMHKLGFPALLRECLSRAREVVLA